MLASPLIGRIFGPGEGIALNPAEQNFPNLFPTNFKYNYRALVTRKLKDEGEIPRDADGRWMPTVSTGSIPFRSRLRLSTSVPGTIMVTRFDASRPFKSRAASSP